MSKVLIIILLIGFISCGENKNSDKKAEKLKIEQTISELTDFDLLQDFERQKAEFTIDTFDINDHSTDGGDLKVFHTYKSDYVVMDFWLYGETGKLNYIYWTDDDFRIKFVKKLDFEYDKPYYLEGFKTDSTIYYLSYSESKARLFDLNKAEISKIELIDSIKTDLESFFENITNEIEIIK